jgi:hypothetical protein
MGDGLRLQIYFKDPDPAVNLARLKALHAKKDQFEQALGESAVWDEMTDRLAARVYVTSPFDSVTDIEQWPAMSDWLIDQHVRFKRAVQAVGGLESANWATAAHDVIIGYVYKCAPINTHSW